MDQNRPYEKRINIRYKKSREEHDALIEDMFEKMDGFLSEIDPEAGEKDRAKKICEYFKWTLKTILNRPITIWIRF